MPNSNTIMQKYGKKLPGGNLKAVVPSAAVSVLTVLPLWLTTLVPMALLEFVASRFKKRIGSK